MAKSSTSGKSKGLVAGVKDPTRSQKPVKSKVKSAKYGFHCKDLSKTKTY